MAGQALADGVDDTPPAIEDLGGLRGESDDKEPLPTECPTCGGGLFALSEVELICLTCDWNNLERVR